MDEEVNIPVPPAFRPSVEKLANLSDEQFDRLLMIIEDAPVGQSVASIASFAAADQLTSTTEVEAQAIMNFAVETRALETRYGLDLNAVSRALARHVAESPDLAGRIHSVLTARAVMVAEKAGWLAAAGERRVVRVQGITDARPVFDKDADGLLGFTVVHTFLVTVAAHDGTESTSQFLVPDTEMAKFADVIERGRRKGSLLRDEFRLRGITDLSR